MTTTLVETTAARLLPGDIIRKAGTTTHSPITVTEARPVLTGSIRVYGFNSYNTEPRCMFRALRSNLRVVVEREV